jgi:Peptidase family M23
VIYGAGGAIGGAISRAFAREGASVVMFEKVARSVILLFVAGVCGSTAGWAQARAPLVQSVDIQIPMPPTPVRIAGKLHLAYELHVTNFRTIDVALTRVAVKDARRGTSLADYRDSELTDRIGRPGVSSELPDKRVIGGGMSAIIYLWLALDVAVATPSRLRHTIEFDAFRPSGRQHGVVEGAETGVSQESPVVLDAPLRGGPWAALYDPSMAGGHRTTIYTIDGRARIPARFAIDWIRLDDDASRARGNEAKVANWHGYGAEVLAVADAIVADARDDMPGAESIGASQGPMALENASGNYVALDLGNGRHAFYEHLKHGSIRVKAGDRVKRGQVIGLLGNTGSSSSGPHLHFHVSDANSTLAAEGLPYVFRSFEVLGAFETIGAAASGERWKPAPQGAGGMRTMELPAPNVVVTFRPGG